MRPWSFRLLRMEKILPRVERDLLINIDSVLSDSDYFLGDMFLGVDYYDFGKLVLPELYIVGVLDILIREF